jgi:hypothetical protein
VRNLVRVACYASDKDWNCNVENSTIGTFKATVKIHVEGKETYIVPEEEFIADARAVYIQKSSDIMVVEVWL